MAGRSRNIDDWEAALIKAMLANGAYTKDQIISYFSRPHRDPNFWSVRVSGDIRLIVHRSEKSLLLCYVGHHDDAYRWAERRKIERHP